MPVYANMQDVLRRLHRRVPEDIVALVARGRLRMDLERPITAEASVWAPEAFPGPAPILLPPIEPGQLP